MPLLLTPLLGLALQWTSLGRQARGLFPRARRQTVAEPDRDCQVDSCRGQYGRTAISAVRRDLNHWFIVLQTIQCYFQLPVLATELVTAVFSLPALIRVSVTVRLRLLVTVRHAKCPCRLCPPRRPPNRMPAHPPASRRHAAACSGPNPAASTATGLHAKAQAEAHNRRGWGRSRRVLGPWSLGGQAPPARSRCRRQSPPARSSCGGRRAAVIWWQRWLIRWERRRGERWAGSAFLRRCLFNPEEI